jgi:hypothetical protein
MFAMSRIVLINYGREQSLKRERNRLMYRIQEFFGSWLSLDIGGFEDLAEAIEYREFATYMFGRDHRIVNDYGVVVVDEDGLLSSDEYDEDEV